MRIAIEGMDGVGKTTLAKQLAEILNYEYIEKPFKILFSNMNLSDDDIKNMEWKLYETEDEAIMTLFYGIGLLYGTRCIQLDNVIYDRHFVSNYYWHSVPETEALHKEFIRLCGIPDLTVLLKATVATRMKRICNRDCVDKDISNSAMYDYGYDKMEIFLKNNNFKYIIIDTENLTQKEVVDIVVEYINSIKEKKLIIERK